MNNGKETKKEEHESIQGLFRSYLVLYILFALLAWFIGVCSSGG
jgi:hypothetical protein